MPGGKWGDMALLNQLPAGYVIDFALQVPLCVVPGRTGTYNLRPYFLKLQLEVIGATQRHVPIN